MSDKHSIAMKEILEMLLDKEWHDIYELHVKYKLSATTLHEAIEDLLKHKLLIKSGMKIKLKDGLNNDDFFAINSLLKTHKPTILTNHDYKRLT